MMAVPIFAILLDVPRHVSQTQCEELRRSLLIEMVPRLPSGAINFRLAIKSDEDNDGHVDAYYNVISDEIVIEGIQIINAFEMAVASWLADLSVQQKLNIQGFSFGRLQEYLG